MFASKRKPGAVLAAAMAFGLMLSAAPAAASIETPEAKAEASDAAAMASFDMEQVFGEAGRHARSAVGVPALPLGAAVEIDAIVAVRPD